MKTLHSIRLFLPGILLFLLGCEKQPFDYRNKYLGEWEFNVSRSELNTDSIGHYESDALIYVGEIAYGDAEDELLIKYTENNSVTLKISEEGKLSDPASNYSDGKFESRKKLHLYLRWGGLGGGIKHVIDGEKK